MRNQYTYVTAIASNLPPVLAFDNLQSSIRKQSKTSISSLSVNSNRFAILTKFHFRKLKLNFPINAIHSLRPPSYPACCLTQQGKIWQEKFSRRFHDISFLIFSISLCSQVFLRHVSPPASLPQNVHEKNYPSKSSPVGFVFVASLTRANLNNVISFLGL